jgi:RNA polymerase sigma-70 factor, ECF subfamily
MGEQALAVAPAERGEIAVEELVRQGNYRAAIQACAQVHGPALGRLCMALLGTQSDAEEVLQETLLAAHDAFSAFRGEGTLRSWLFGIARRQCARRYESRRREADLAHEPSLLAEVAAPDTLVDQRRRASRVRAQLAALTETEREALLLRYQAGLSYREVGEACGVDEATARKRASRGLSRLRSLVEDVK